MVDYKTLMSELVEADKDSLFKIFKLWIYFWIFYSFIFKSVNDILFKIFKLKYKIQMQAKKTFRLSGLTRTRSNHQANMDFAVSILCSCLNKNAMTEKKNRTMKINSAFTQWAAHLLRLTMTGAAEKKAVTISFIDTESFYSGAKDRFWQTASFLWDCSSFKKKKKLWTFRHEETAEIWYSGNRKRLLRCLLYEKAVLCKKDTSSNDTSTVLEWHWRGFKQTAVVKKGL